MVSKLVFNSSELWGGNTTTIESIDAALFSGEAVVAAIQYHASDMNDDSEERKCNDNANHNQQYPDCNLNLVRRMSKSCC